MIQPDVSFARTSFRVAVSDSRGYGNGSVFEIATFTLTGYTSCECFYNVKRRHSTIGYLIPVEFEDRMKLA